MSAADARRTVQVFMNVVDEARDMVTAAGAIGHVLTELLRHAEELLDVIDDELSDLDRSQHVELFAAAPILRQKLERLRADLRGGASMRRLAWSELLDVMGDELLEVDRDQHGELSAAAPILRQKLSRLRDELRGRPCQLTGGPSRRLPITNRCRPVRFGAGLGIAARQSDAFPRDKRSVRKRTEDAEGARMDAIKNLRFQTQSMSVAPLLIGADLTPYFSTSANLKFVGSGTADPITIGIGFGGQIAERAMRSNLIVVNSPSFGCDARLLDGEEEALVQAFITALAVETFDEGVLDRLSWPDELQLDAHTPMRPFHQRRGSSELRAVVHAECQPSRVTASFGLSVDRRRDPRWLTLQILPPHATWWRSTSPATGMPY